MTTSRARRPTPAGGSARAQARLTAGAAAARWTPLSLALTPVPAGHVRALQRLAGNQATATMIAPPVPLQRYGALEHKQLGDVATGGRPIELAPGLTVTHGDMVSLGGDLFGSIEEVMTLARRPGTGKGTRGEIVYAVNEEVRAKFQPKLKLGWDATAKEAVQERYYKLAADNATHFVNIDQGDAASDVKTRHGKRARRRNPQTGAEELVPVNAGGSYQQNHEAALRLAVQLGRTGRPLDPAMAVEAFGAHFLTDAFSAGHVRTERRSIRRHWNDRVPLFYTNFLLFLAEELAKELHPNIPDFAMYKSKWRAGKVPFTSIDLRPAGSKTQVEQKLANLPRMTFGDVVGLAIHDFDSDRGVEARVGGKAVRLAGDSRLFKRDRKGNVVLDAQKRPVVAEAKTFDAITIAVRKSMNEVAQAYALGRRRRTADAVVAELRRRGRGVFPVERLLPVPVADADLKHPAADAAVKWDYDTVEELLGDHEVRLALDAFAVEKAKEFQSILGGMGKAEQQALDKRIVARLTGGPMAVAKLLRDIIDYSPDTHGGIFGQKEDERAIAYFREAKREKAAGTLTMKQKQRLLGQLLRGPTVGADDTTILEILASKRSDAPELIRALGWRWMWSDLSGGTLGRFVHEFGPAFWATQPFAAKRAEVQFHASGITTEIAEETIIVILQTCKRDEVRAIDRAAGGLDSELTGKEQREFDRLRK